MFVTNSASSLVSDFYYASLTGLSKGQISVKSITFITLAGLFQRAGLLCLLCVTLTGPDGQVFLLVIVSHSSSHASTAAPPRVRGGPSDYPKGGN